MKIRKPSRIASVGLTALLAVGATSKTLSDVVIKTELPETNLIADGTTVYQMNVRGNTMQYPGTRFNISDWDVVVPYYVTVIDAKIPDPNNPAGPSANPDDFFFPQLPEFDGMMFENFVDSGPYPFTGGGELVNNSRSTYNVFTGPADLNDRLLGTYWFTINQGAPLGQGNFNLNDVAFMDTGFNEYNDPNSGNGLVTIQNDQFTVRAPPDPASGDFDGDGDVDLDDFGQFASCYNGATRPPADTCPPGVNADFDSDGDVDLDDFSTFAANYTGSL